MLFINNLNLLVARRRPPRPRPDDWVPTAQLTVSFTATFDSREVEEEPWNGEIFIMGADEGTDRAEELFKMIWLEWVFTGIRPFRWEPRLTDSFVVDPRAGNNQSFIFQMTVPISQLDEDPAIPLIGNFPGSPNNISQTDEVFAQVQLASGDSNLPPVNSNIVKDVFEETTTR